MPFTDPAVLRSVVEKMDQYSINLANTCRELPTLDPDSDATNEWKSDKGQQLAEELIDIHYDFHNESDLWIDRTDLPGLLVHIRAQLLHKEAWLLEKEAIDFLPPYWYVPVGLSPNMDTFPPYDDLFKFTLLRSFLRWTILETHEPSGEAHSLLQMHYAVDGEGGPTEDEMEYVIPESKGDRQLVLVRQKYLPRLIELWGNPVIECDPHEIASMGKVSTINMPNCDQALALGNVVLAWKVTGENQDMWIDAEGFVIPGVPDLI
ncbi:hypothetical protein IL306_007140 [Fusarium sp. DS 682]|nr:hypothetical protein IL306_007140 [Fusarium sp. DS 682]